MLDEGLVPSALEAERWFSRRARCEAVAVRLFCFAHAGGTAAIYRDWQDYLPASCEVLPVQLPGRGVRYGEPLVKDLRSLTARVTEAIARYVDVPYVLFGHSLGALIAHQVSVELVRGGYAIARRLVVSARAAPSDRNRYSPVLATSPDDELLLGLAEYAGTPKEVLADLQLMKVVMPILRADLVLSESEDVQRQKLSCPITVFAGERDRIDVNNLTLWREETTAQCNVVVFPGSHFFLHEDKRRFLDALAALLF